MRAFVANLDCELSWARDSSPGPHKAKPSAVRRAVSSFSSSLRCLAGEPEQFLTLDDLANESISSIADTSAILCWGQTSIIASRPTPLDANAPWQERLWQLRCSPSIAAQCNARDFALGLKLEHAYRLSDVTTVSSIEALDRYLATARLGPDDSWVAKAPWSASGREKLKRRGRVVEGEQRAFASRLLRRYGWLLVEPWMERVADFGVSGLVGESDAESEVFAAHQLLCDAGGVFRGIRIDDEATRQRLGPFSEPLADAARTTARALREHGYRGPFGIYAFLYNEAGAERLRAVCEINARLSFGHAARALADRAGGTYDFAL